LAYEAAENGPLSLDLAAGIRRVKGVKSLGAHIGNWLSIEQARKLLATVNTENIKGKRDHALLALLLGCGFQRAELVLLELKNFELREDHWLVPDLVGKGGHIRTVPVPNWVQDAVNVWTAAAKIASGIVFRAIDKSGHVSGDGLSAKVIWTVVRQRANQCGLKDIAPHDLRRYAESRTMPNALSGSAPAKQAQ
jgi:site-specific recombinase XerD